MDSRQRAAAEDQLRILELLEVAVERRKEVLEIIESAEDTDEAQERIREAFGVQDPHISQAVLDMQVSRWTRAGRQRIAAQADELRRLLNA